MSDLEITRLRHWPGRLAWGGCLALLLALLLPLAVLAAPPTQDYVGPETCALCHQAEVQSWQDSPHAFALEAIDQAHQEGCTQGQGGEDCACLSCHTTDFNAQLGSYTQAGVTCEACHGPYVKDHPENGIMRLDVDSSICSQCHVETHEHWQDTAHAEAGVQCIGCHKAHTTDLRLADETLCVSCHRAQLADAGHSAHHRHDVACIDCHASPVELTTSLDVDARGTLSPDHDFTVVADVCANCHGDTFQAGDSLAAAGRNMALADQADQAAPAAVEPVAEECVAVEDSRQSMAMVAAGVLGLGMGMGAIMGVVGIMVVGYVSRGRSES